MSWSDSEETLAQLLPQTLAAVERGEITTSHARYLVEQTRGIDPELSTTIEAAVLPAAAGQSHAEFRRAVRRQYRLDQPARKTYAKPPATYPAEAKPDPPPF